jgi:hypothetical protein
MNKRVITEIGICDYQNGQKALKQSTCPTTFSLIYSPSFGTVSVEAPFDSFADRAIALALTILFGTRILWVKKKL